MLPEIGGLEWLVIAVVALVVIGPKDLPVMMRKLGQFTAKLRGMAAEFRSSFDEMARQSELEDLRKEVEAMRRGQFGAIGDVGGEMRSAVSEIESSLGDVGVQLHEPMSYQYDDHQPPPLEISEAPAEAPKPEKKASSRSKAPVKAKAASSKVAKAPASKAAAPKAVSPKASARTAPVRKARAAPEAVAEAPKSRRRAAKIVEGGA